MQTLHNRISALEQAIPEGIKVMFIILVGMGEVGMKITHIHDNHGNQWDCRPEETEEAFKDRAKSETPRKENQVVLLFGEKKARDTGGTPAGHWRDTAGQIAKTIENQ